MRRIRRGDDAAFEVLYHRYQRRITAYVFGMVHDHGRAEDLAQDVFVSALRRMRDTDRPIAFKPWIYEIAKNACIDAFRRSKRAEEVSYDAEEGLAAADFGRLVSAEAVPEDELESKQQLDHLRGAFGGLSEMHHEILVMRELEGLSYRQIGEKLGMSRPSVESTLFRARRRLTEEYEELVTGARCQRIQAIIGTAAEAELGLRDQRRLARHVSHCQPCRRQARMAGLDLPVTADRPVRQRIAALLPLPLFLRRRWASAGSPSSSSPLSGAAQWTAQVGSTFDPSWVKAAATAAAVAVAGVGAGLASNPRGGLRSSLPLSPVSHAAPADRDRVASTPSAAGSATAVSTFAAARSGSRAVASHAASAAAAAPTSGATKPAPAAPVPDVTKVAGDLGQQAGGALPAAPSAPSTAGPVSARKLPTLTTPQTPKVDPTAAPIQPPGVGGTVAKTTTGATNAAGDVTKKAGSLLGGG